MKNWKLFFVLGIATLLFSCSQPKIAYINIEDLMQEYEATKELERLLAEKQAAYSKELDSMQAPFQQKLQEYYSTVGTMSALTKTRWEQELQQEQQVLQAKQQEISMLLQNENQRESEILTKKVDSFVAEYAQKEKLNLILGTTGKGTVLYGDEQMDITHDILELLNTDYNNDTGK